jgi:Cytochrome P460
MHRPAAGASSFWAEGDAKKPQVTDATKQCFACHEPKKDQDYVYSTYIP